MKRIKTMTIRFNLDKPADRAAWDHLRSLDRKQYRSFSRAVIAAVNEHFEQQANPPFFGSAKRDDRFFQRVGEAVSSALSDSSAASVLGLAQMLRGLPGPVSGDSAQEDAAAMNESLDDALDFMNGL